LTFPKLKLQELYMTVEIVVSKPIVSQNCYISTLANIYDHIIIED